MTYKMENKACQLAEPEGGASVPIGRAHRFLGGLALNYSYQFILMVTAIWLTPFYLGRLGQANYGFWLVGTQLLTYLTLIDLGVVALLPLEIAYATGRAGRCGNPRELSQIIGQTARLVLYQLPLLILVATAMWLLTPISWQTLRGPLTILLFGFVLVFPLRIFPALLQGLQDLSFLSAMQILSFILSTGATVALVFVRWDLYALAVGWLLGQTVLTPIFIYRIRKRFPNILPHRIPDIDWQMARLQLGKGLWISVSQIAQLLLGNTDVLIIGAMLGPEAVVPYACTGKLASVLGNQAQIMMQTATPGLCELKTADSRQTLSQVLIALSQSIMTFSGLVFCTVLLVNRWFVSWWVKGSQYGGFFLTVAILTNVLVRHWNMSTAYSVFCLGHQRRISLTNLSDGLVTATVSLGLTPIVGLAGPPVGSLVGACIVSLPCNLRIIAQETGVTVWHLITAMLRSWSWRFVAVGAAAWLISVRWSPTNFLEAGAVATCAAGAYLLLIFPTFLKPPLANHLRPLMASFIGKCAALQARFAQ